MQQLMQFVMNHWALSGLFVLILIVILLEEARSQGAGRWGLTPDRATELINSEKAAILDVRETNAFKDGHIVDAINIPQDVLEQNQKRIEKYKQQPIIVVCSSGQKALLIAAKLRKQAFEKVYVLSGGLSAWKNAELPLVKK